MDSAFPSCGRDGVRPRCPSKMTVSRDEDIDLSQRFDPTPARASVSRTLRGPLTFGFSVYGDSHHFGPELQFGHILGDHFENQVLLIKTAWGGKSLYQDFRPPSSGGEVGRYYKLMIAQVREALANLKKDFPGYDGAGHELAGFVWYQGWNDGVSPKDGVVQYETNLVNLIRDVRKEFNTPKLPVVIGELTGPWLDAPPEWTKLRQAQATVRCTGRQRRKRGRQRTFDHLAGLETDLGCCCIADHGGISDCGLRIADFQITCPYRSPDNA